MNKNKTQNKIEENTLNTNIEQKKNICNYRSWKQETYFLTFLL